MRGLRARNKRFMLDEMLKCEHNLKYIFLFFVSYYFFPNECPWPSLIDHAMQLLGEKLSE